MAEDLKLKDEEIRKIRVEHNADLKKLKQELRSKEQAVVVASIKPETKEVGEQADDKKSEKEELFSLKRKLKILEHEKRTIEMQRDDYRDKIENSDRMNEDLEEMKEQMRLKDVKIQSLTEDLLQRKKQMTTDRKNIKQLEKQLSESTLILQSERTSRWE